MAVVTSLQAPKRQGPLHLHLYAGKAAKSQPAQSDPTVQRKERKETNHLFSGKLLLAKQLDDVVERLGWNTQWFTAVLWQGAC